MTSGSVILASTMSTRAILTRVLTVTALYFTLAELSYLVSHSVSLGVSLFPAAGVSVIALLMTPRCAWWAILAGVALAEVSLDTLHHSPLLVIVGFALANALEPLLAASLILRYGGRPFSLERVQSVTVLGLAALVSTMGSGLIAGGAVSLAGVSGFWHKWNLWWTQDLIGGLAGAAVLVVWVRRPKLSAKIAVEGFAILAVIGLAMYFIGAQRAPLVYMLAPLLVWSAVRFGPVGVSAAALLVVVAGEWSAWKDIGPFSQGASLGVRITLTQTFVGALLVMVLLLHASISQRRAADEGVVELETIGRAAGGIAHDVNNLVQQILINCELLFAQTDPSDERWPHLESIARAAEHSFAVADKLQRVSHREYDVDTSPCDLNNVIRDIEPILRSSLASTALELRLTSSPLPVHADPAAIEQILLNFVVNAGEACGDRGTVIVTTSAGCDPGHLAGMPFAGVQVADDGAGMAHAVLAHALDPWFTTKGSRSRGTGLANVARIVDQQRGTVNMASKLGAGTSVTVRLPMSTSTPPGVDTESPPCEDARGGRILVCSPDDAARRAWCELLRLQGFATLQARAGGEALQISRAHSGPIHLVVTDVMMAGLTGPKMAARLRHERPDVKVLLITDFVDDSITDELSRVADRVLVTPLRGDELVSEVCKLVPDLVPFVGALAAATADEH